MNSIQVIVYTCHFQLVDQLISRDTADSFRELIKDDEVNDNQVYGTVLDGLNDSGTTHISVVDNSGNAVSVTATLNFRYVVMALDDIEIYKI